MCVWITAHCTAPSRKSSTATPEPCSFNKPLAIQNNIENTHALSAIPSARAGMEGVLFSVVSSQAMVDFTTINALNFSSNFTYSGFSVDVLYHEKNNPAVDLIIAAQNLWSCTSFIVLRCPLMSILIFNIVWLDYKQMVIAEDCILFLSTIITIKIIYTNNEDRLYRLKVASVI